MKENKRLNIYQVTMVTMFLLIVLFNLAACSSYFCEWYRNNIYGYIADGLGSVTALILFPLGEIIMYLGIVLVITLLVSTVFLIFLRKKQSYRMYAIRLYKTTLAIILVMLLVYTFNWIIPFRCDGMKFEGLENKKYSVEELQILRNYILEQMEENARLSPRDEGGHLIFGNNVNEQVIKSMNKLGERYPLLKGYEPPMKDALCSDFLDWMDIGGFTYPYTMEVTGNKYVTGMYYPVLYSHELSHHKGYYREDEANFFSYLACTESDDYLLKYAGYYDMYFYIDNAYYDSLISLYGEDAGWDLYYEQPRMSELIEQDEMDAIEEYQEQYDEEVNKTLEVLSPYAEEVAEVGWDTQADILQEACYDGVVELLLKYFDGVLY